MGMGRIVGSTDDGFGGWHAQEPASEDTRSAFNHLIDEAVSDRQLQLMIHSGLKRIHGELVYAKRSRGANIHPNSHFER